MEAVFSNDKEGFPLLNQLGYNLFKALQEPLHWFTYLWGGLRSQILH